MRAVIQRINGAESTINGGETRKVGEGLVVFICAMEGDTDAQADFLVQKVCGLRVFKDENDKMNRSLEDIKGDMLIVSNITLSADMKHGRRPDFSRSASPSEALRLYNYFVEQVKNQPIGKAFFFSLVVCFRNIGAIACLGLLLFLLASGGAVAFGALGDLGQILVILWALFVTGLSYSSLYPMWRSIFESEVPPLH